MLKLCAISLIYSPEIPGNSIIISPDIQQKMNLTPGQPLHLMTGNRRTPVYFLGVSDLSASHCLYVSKNIKQQLLLPAPLKLNLDYDQTDGTIRLGPLIGIFAGRCSRNTKPFGEQTTFFRKLRCAADVLNSFCFAFSPNDIDWVNQTIKGSVPPASGDESAGWQTYTLPFPDVIYDRGLFQKGEKRQKATETRKILRNYPGVKMFNPAFFGKWKTHKLLSKHETLYMHLPETALYTGARDVLQFLQTHDTVYLKPSGGSSGKGIIRVTSSSSGFTVYYRTGGIVKTIYVTKRLELESCIEQMIGNRRYIIQQGLRLAKLQGCPFDIRILMQRNIHGQWRRTGMAIRVASPGNYISNLHAGGRAEKISRVLPQVLPDYDLANKVVNDIRRICALIVSWVTTADHSLFGEIAIDLGIDDSGKVWIIELNAVPGRSIFRHIKSPKIRAQAISRPMEYALFISGFAPHSIK